MRAAGREAVGMWSGHGMFANNYGTRLHSHLLRRFANLYGCQWWNPTMICWGLGAFGLGLTGVLEANTKEDMGEHARLVLLWGANLASQPTTGPPPGRGPPARGPGDHDGRARTEAAAQSDEVFLIRPGTDAALALAMMHVIVAEGLQDEAFIDRHTVGFHALAGHLRAHGPEWAAPITGIPAERIVALARGYAGTRPGDDRPGGQLDAQGRGTAGRARRAIGCLPALTGNLGIPGGGFGPATARPRTARRSGHHRARATAAGRLRAEPDAARHRGAPRQAGAGDAAVRHRHAVLVRRRRAGGRGARSARTWW